MKVERGGEEERKGETEGKEINEGGGTEIMNVMENR
jgi:hypothetical protein